MNASCVKIKLSIIIKNQKQLRAFDSARNWISWN